MGIGDIRAFCKAHDSEFIARPSLRRLGSVVCCLLLLVSFGCHRPTTSFAPQLQHAVQDSYLHSLPSAFPPLSGSEKREDWAREYTIGKGFAHQLDLYQAMTAFRRTEFLLPPSDTKRLDEVRYDTVLCYYLGQKWRDVLYAYQSGVFSELPREFPAFHDLLVILYDSFLHNGDERGADRLLLCLRNEYPETAKKLVVSTAIQRANFLALRDIAKQEAGFASIQTLLDAYTRKRKSPTTAQLLNAFIPGTGYFYLGQPQSGITALLLNGLFIAATYHFYAHQHIAAGTLFAGFELGWYFGGIFGAAIEAKHYNQRVYEQLAGPLMHQEQLFPVLMLQYGF